MPADDPIRVFLVHQITLYNNSYMRYSFTVFIVFVIHLVSGVVHEKFNISIFSFSVIGVANWISIGLFIALLSIDEFRSKLKYVDRAFLYILASYALISTPSLLANIDLRSFIAFTTKLLSLASIYYLSYIAWMSVRKIEVVTSRGLSRIIWFFIVAGAINAITLGFSFEAARNVSDRFSFLLFEYPHSAGIFLATLLPLYYGKIREGSIPAYHYLFVYFGLPLVVLYTGAKVAFLTYIISLGLTVLYLHARNIKGLFISWLVITTGIIFVINTSLYVSILEILDTPIEEYISDTREYSINSMHTRIKVWAAMWFHSLEQHTMLFGEGFRSWGLVYKDLWGMGSSQSDYFTAYFELGVLGLIALIVYKVGSIFLLIRKNRKSTGIAGVLAAIGIFAGMVLGGFTENAEGYASTSWIIPVMISYISVVGRKRIGVYGNGTKLSLNTSRPSG